jgi:hypothetical protein
VPIFRERRDRRLSEAAHNAGVERELIEMVIELFGDGRTPSRQERELTGKRLRKLLFGNKQLNPAERMGIEGRVWRHFRSDSPERGYLNEIGFLSWN